MWQRKAEVCPDRSPCDNFYTWPPVLRWNRPWIKVIWAKHDMAQAWPKWWTFPDVSFCFEMHCILLVTYHLLIMPSYAMYVIESILTYHLVQPHACFRLRTHWIGWIGSWDVGKPRQWIIMWICHDLPNNWKIGGYPLANDYITTGLIVVDSG